MKIDDSIVVKYLQDDLDFQDHWVFSEIVAGKILFELPDLQRKKDVRELLDQSKTLIEGFQPCNSAIYTDLFPAWQEITAEITVLFAVGCPRPYDAMVRSFQNQEYIILDLLRFLDYVDKGHHPESLIRQLVTHETLHTCLHRDYDPKDWHDYRRALMFTAFDEGFAHLISMQANILATNFSERIDRYYRPSLTTFKKALLEENEETQNILIEQSNSGPYWEKFAAISGMLFLARHIGEIGLLYRQGIERFIQTMISE
jgi:hypothetical protein